MSGSRGISPTKAKSPPRPPAPSVAPLPAHPPPSRPRTPYQPPLLLTVRFSASLPDILLDIPYPSQTTVVALKHLIRGRLAQPNARGRLRFIHGGKILPDGAILSAVLRALPPPPAPPPQNADPRGKGKATEGAPPAQRVYVNCSIGDPLAPAELDEEAAAARAPVPAPATTKSTPSSTTTAAADGRGGGGGGGGRGAGTGLQLGTGVPRSRHGAWASATTGGASPAPARGFDRLLAASFTQAEVNQLRLQFMSVQSSRYTPDAMPSPDTVRSMEDAWLDNQDVVAAAHSSGGAEAAGEGDARQDGVLDLMVKGMIVGFVWPLASMTWVARQDGMSTRKWRIFITFGIILSFVIGMIKSMSGDK